MLNKIYYQFPIILDNTQITTFKASPILWFYKHILHIQGEASVHLHFGGAYADGQEACRKAYYIDKKTQEEAVQLGLQAIESYWGDAGQFADEAKNLDTCLMLLQTYYWTYPFDVDEYKPIALTAKDGTESSAIEFNFMEEVAKHPDFPEVPVMFTGRADMVTESPYQKPGTALVFDDKTTGSYLSDKMSAQWVTRSQFSAYCWGLQKKGFDVAGAVVSMASIPKSRKLSFDRYESPRTDFMIESWANDMHRTVQMMIEYYRETVAEHKLYPDKPLPSIVPYGCLGEGFYSYFRPSYFTSAYTHKTGETAILASAKQNIWLPHEQRRAGLADYLDSLGINKEDFLWAEVENTTGGLSMEGLL